MVQDFESRTVPAGIEEIWYHIPLILFRLKYLIVPAVPINLERY